MNENTLTRTDLAALKQADYVGFRTSFITSDYNQPRALTASIECTKQIKNAGPFGEKEKRYTLECIPAAVLADYTRSSNDNETLRFVPEDAYHGINYCQSHLEWKTIADSLKVGDQIKLVWENNGGNPELLEEGFYHTRLLIEVSRAVGKTGKRKTLSFCVDTHVSRRPWMITGEYVREAKKIAA